MDKYFVFNSSDSKEYFPNTPYRFRVKLSHRLQLDGLWMLALAELRFGKLDLSNINNFNIDVMCNLCNSSYVGDDFIPLLRRVDLRDGPNYQFNQLFFVPVIVKDVSTVEIYIKCTQGTPQSFLKEDVNLTLLLRHYPFIE